MLSNYISLNSNVNTNLSSWYYIDPKPESAHITGQILAFNDSTSRILNTILLLCKRYKLVYASQKTIARMSKVHIVTANRALAKLEDLGLIAIKNNGANKSCWYKSSTYFNDLFVMETLSKKLAIFYFTITMLISAAREDAIRCIKDPSLLYPSLAKATTSSTTILSKNLKKEKMFEAQHEVTQQVLDLNLKLTIQQQQQLSKFHPTVITRATDRLKLKKNPNDPVSYFFWLCKDEQANPTTVAKEVVAKNYKKVEEVAEQFEDADLGIMPSIDLSAEDNMRQWEIYEMSAQYWAQQSDFHRNILKSRKEKYIVELERHTPENLDRWRKKAKEMRELYPYTKEGIQGLGELFGIKPQSTTLNDKPIEPPKTQPEEKDSTNYKFEQVSSSGEPTINKSKKVGYVIYKYSNGDVDYKYQPDVYESIGKPKPTQPVFGAE